MGINGKVTFVEKLGTGAANSSGAFEFDPAFSNDFDKAWRTMHMKSDVFCSASVTLPDKKGRMLNVGGWSGVSTFGVRLYTPDGSPGTSSVNDWEEDDGILTLQKGRWYPGVMVMTNGSILVCDLFASSTVSEDFNCLPRMSVERKAAMVPQYPLSRFCRKLDR